MIATWKVTFGFNSYKVKSLKNGVKKLVDRHQTLFLPSIVASGGVKTVKGDSDIRVEDFWKILLVFLLGRSAVLAYVMLSDCSPFVRVEICNIDSYTAAHLCFWSSRTSLSHLKVPDSASELTSIASDSVTRLDRPRYTALRVPRGLFVVQ
jgi:hypothetical protein